MNARAGGSRRSLALGLMLVLLAGCSGSNEFSDLRAFFDEVAGEPTGRVQPLPEFKPYESFKYGAANLRSPFQAPLGHRKPDKQAGTRIDSTACKPCEKLFGGDEFGHLANGGFARASWAVLRAH